MAFVFALLLSGSLVVMLFYHLFQCGYGGVGGAILLQGHRMVVGVWCLVFGDWPALFCEESMRFGSYCGTYFGAG